jgi:hypothetical protein
MNYQYNDSQSYVGPIAVFDDASMGVCGKSWHDELENVALEGKQLFTR